MSNRAAHCCRIEAVGYQRSVRLDSCMFEPECHPWRVSVRNCFQRTAMNSMFIAGYFVQGSWAFN